MCELLLGKNTPYYASEDTEKNTVIPLLGWETGKGLRRLHPQNFGKSSDTTNEARQTFPSIFQ